MLGPCLTLLIGWELLNIFLGVVFKSVVPFMYHVGCTPSFLLAIFLVLYIYIYRSLFFLYHLMVLLVHRC